MTDEESSTESQPTESQDLEQSTEQTNSCGPQDDQPTESSPVQSQNVEQIVNYDDAAPTEMIGLTQTGPGSRDRTIKRVAIVGGAIVVVSALAFGLTQIIRKDAPPAVQETAAAEVFLEPADAAGDSPFAPTSFASTQQDPTNPGADPLGPPPAAPAPPPDGEAAPMALRTANGDLPGLYGGTLDTTTCDAELMINYLGENPNKARAWASVHRINPDQIRGYVTELTPVLLRTDTRLTDHGYIEVGQSIPRQAVLQAGTAVMVDKYGSPRVRCISGSPLLDPVALTAAAPARGQAPAPAARPAGSVAVQPAAAPAQPRVIFVGLRWPRFDPATIVVIRRIARIIEYFLIWDFRRGAIIARRIGILIRDIANLLDPRLARIVPVNLRPRPPAALPPAPLPLQPPRILPQRPPVQQLPAQVPPVQQAPPARIPAAPPAQQAPPPAAPPVQLPPAAPPAAPPPIVDTWDPPIYDPGPSLVDPPIWNPPYDPDPPVHVPSAPSISGPVQQAPVDDGTGTHVPPITDSCSNPAYPCLPQAPSSGGHDTAPIPDNSGSGGYTEPDYGSLPGPSDSTGQCDPVYGCY